MLLRYSCVSLAIVFGFITIVSSINPIDDTREPTQRCTDKPFQFTDNTNGTIKDNCTGLIWLKNVNAFDRMTWENAMTAAAALQDGEYGLSDGSEVGDWRLPTRTDMLYLIDPRFENPALCNMTGDAQWTAEEGPWTGSFDSRYSSHISLYVWTSESVDGYQSGDFNCDYLGDPYLDPKIWIVQVLKKTDEKWHEPWIDWTYLCERRRVWPVRKARPEEWF